MNGPEHYAEAERLLADAQRTALTPGYVRPEDVPAAMLVTSGQTALAQVHATLALAAATVSLGVRVPREDEDWTDAPMTVYKLDGLDLRMVFDALADKPYTLRVAIDEGGVKFKIDNGTWSPALGSEES